MKNRDLNLMKSLNETELKMINAGAGYGEEWQVPGALDGARKVIGYIITFPSFLF